jgi:hypothetical protein
MLPLLQKALQHSFSPKKVLLAFPFLFLCSALVLFCQKLLTQTENWLFLSLAFLPILVTGILLLTLGIILIRSYHQEKNQQKHFFFDTLKQSLHILLKLFYFALPLALIVLAKKLLVFCFMGILYLCKHFGLMTEGTETFVTSSLPVFMICGIILLSFVSLFTLYFITPHLAFAPSNPFRLLQDLFKNAKNQTKKYLLLLGIGTLPILISSPLLFLSLSPFSWNPFSLSIAYPLALLSILVAPSIIFFFNFSLESYHLLSEVPIVEKIDS